MPVDFTFTVSATWTDDLKGFRIFKDVEPVENKDYMADTGEAEQIPRMNQLFLQVILDYCASIGATPVFVSTPSSVFWSAEKHNGIAAYAESAGIDYIDLNVEPTKIPIDWETESYDKGYHINISGAQKVSAFIGEYLASTYNLPDHRDDPVYAAWDDALATYTAQLQSS